MRSGIPPRVLRRAAWIAGNIALIALAAVVVSRTIGAAGGASSGVVATATASPEVKRAAIPMTDAPPRAESTGLSGADLAASNAALRAEYNKLAGWILDNFRGKIGIEERLLTHYQLPLVASNDAVDADLGSFLKLSDAEKTGMESVLADAKNLMQSTEAGILSISQSNDTGVTIYIPPYERNGAELKENLLGKLENILGPYRMDRMADVTGKDLDRTYHYFGTAARTVHFELVNTPGSDAPYLLIRDGWEIPDGTSTIRHDGTESAVREIPREYSGFLQHLPAVIAGFPVK